MVTIFEKIQELDNERFRTPIVVDYDKDYYGELELRYKEIIETINGCEDEILKKEVSNITNKLLEAIQHWYSGEVSESYSDVSIAVSDILKSKWKDFIPDNVNANDAFKNYARHQNEDNLEDRDDYKAFLYEKVNFYRCRVSKDKKHFSSKDMLHIPFDKRGLVSNQRFSIDGVPCMYLSTSSYCCWKELDMPDDNDLYLSHIYLDKKVKLFNLAVNLDFLKNNSNPTDLDDGLFNFNQEDFISSYFKVWLISLACSFSVKEENRIFKSEYIIPQLVMYELKKNNIDGVIYYSHKFGEEISNSWFCPKNLNIAIVSEYDTNDSESKVSLVDKVDITDAINYGEFKQLDNKVCNKINSKARKSKDILNSKQNRVPIAGMYHRYEDTDFYKFEEYIKGLRAINEEKKECHN